MRRSLLTVLAVLCDVTGGVWILQGIGVLPGSFMTGQAKINLWSVGVIGRF